MKFRYIFYICVFLAVISGCAKPPLAEMESAREAVFRAESNADAAQYSIVSLSRARSALDQMEEAAANKRYDAAKTHAEEAIAAAEKAMADGRAAGGRAREEAASLISALKPEIEETSRNVSAARYSDLPLDYDALDRDLMSAYVQTDQAESDYADGRYQDSIDNARGVRSNLSGINQRISTVIPRSKS